MVPNSYLTLQNLFPPDLQQISRSVFKQDFFVSLLEISRLVQNAEYLKSWLSSKEHDVYQSYKLEKRRNEYLAGRVSAKLAVMHVLPCSYNRTSFTDIEICYEPSGRPYISLPGKTPEMIDISISHSGQYGCCLAANSPCGIDIQSAETTLAKVQDRFCTDQEKAVLAAQIIDLKQLAVLWAGKEAIKKRYGKHGSMPGFLDIILLREQSLSQHIQHLTFSLSQTGAEIQVIASTIDQYALAMTIS